MSQMGQRTKSLRPMSPLAVFSASARLNIGTRFANIDQIVPAKARRFMDVNHLKEEILRYRSL
jgi:hypothetical protein